MAPEIFERKGYNDSVDWWSLGCLMYEMLDGRPLFNYGKDKFKPDPNEYKKKIVYPNNFSDEAKDLIKQLLNLDPNKRLGSGPNGFENLKSHKYFEDIDWDDLENKKVDAPFVPKIDGPLDLKYFDKAFTDEVNITKEYDELNITNKTIDNYINFTYMDPTNNSLKEKENQYLDESNENNEINENNE